jgi:thymidylate kinase
VKAADLDSWALVHEVVVLEGCDGVGKTTLAAALATRHAYQMVHATRTPPGVDLTERYTEILARPGRLVLDRSFVSELVYGPIERGHSRLTFTQAADLARTIARRGGILVHVTATPETIHARLERRDGIAPTLRQVRTLTDRYTDVFADLGTIAPVVTVDTTNSDGQAG